MENQQNPEQEELKMIEIDIKQFLAAARTYLLDLLPTHQQQELASAPLHKVR